MAKQKSVSRDKRLIRCYSKDLGIGVNVYTDNIFQNPYCPHGPTVLFERLLINGRTKKFYACSACRDRKVCGFYLDAEDKTNIGHNKQISEREEDEYFKFCMQRYQSCKTLIEKSSEEICCCVMCSCTTSGQLLFRDSELKFHSDCTIIKNLTKQQLCFPSKLLQPQSNSKSEAQYLFAEKSVNVILQLLRGIHTIKVISIGTPRIHEAVKADDSSSMSSLLLDIDKRFSSFFPPTESLTYNLFNHYFFGGMKAKLVYRQFLTGKEKIVLVIDPPFGGRMELIASTLKEIQEEWRVVNFLSEKDILPILLIFPYFMEKTVLQNLPTFTMLDYKVDYSNHEIYTTGPKGMKHGSAVRIFVNMPANQFPLPEDEGYRLCTHCSRWVYANNIHCFKCGTCTSKDGRTYKHCDSCGRCVKPSWVHCQICSRCQPADHSCQNESKNKEFKCNSCGKGGHKWRSCPKRKRASKGERKSLKKKKKSIPQSETEEIERNMKVLQDIMRR